MRENLTSRSYGEGLETGRKPIQVPRQSLTRQRFHKILKSGCRAEDSRLRTAERLVNLRALFSILSWRVFWVTRLGRAALPFKAPVVFTRAQLQILQCLHRNPSVGRTSLEGCILQLAKLGGYLARSGSPDRYSTWLCFSRKKLWVKERIGDRLQIYRLLRRYGVALCLADSARYPRHAVLTTDFAYYRLHGRPELFASPYSEAELERAARQLQTYSDAGVDV